jgi:hypothetical protein
LCEALGPGELFGDLITVRRSAGFLILLMASMMARPSAVAMKFESGMLIWPLLMPLKNSMISQPSISAIRSKRPAPMRLAPSRISEFAGS